MLNPLVPETSLAGLRLLRRGKVRDVYDLGDHVLLVATDRVSAFDCVLAPAIPYKGAVLNRLSAWWFRLLEQRGLATHFVTDDVGAMPPEVRAHDAVVRGRATLARKAAIVPVECVVRGYLAGSAVKEYRQTGGLWGEPLPAGLEAGDALPAPLFTPTTKADAGHDLPLTLAALEAAHGRDLAQALSEQARAAFQIASDIARGRGLLLVDTKLELGRDASGALVICDEAFTPDSSRYWEVAAWRPQTTPPAFDKQVVRDHLLATGWDQTPPAPPLPPDVVIETARRYLALYRLLTGGTLG